jgi:hypothetical protein
MVLFCQESCDLPSSFEFGSQGSLGIPLVSLQTLTNISHFSSAGRHLLCSLHGFCSVRSPVIYLFLLSLDPEVPLGFHSFLFGP